MDGQGIAARVTKTENDIITAQSEIKQTETSITQVVTAVGKNGKVTAASIMTAINNDHSEVKIQADHIIMTGNVTISSLIGSDNSGNLIVAKNIYAGLGGSNYIQGKTLRLVGNSSSQGADVQTLSAGDISGMIIKAEVSGNTLRLWRHGNTTTTPSISFSRATALSGAWSGGKITVSANADNVPDLVQEIRGGDGSRSGVTVSIPINAYTEQGRLIGSTGRTVSHVLTQHTNCVSGLARYNNLSDGRVHLYAKSGNTYYDCGNHYWYYKDTNQDLTTYYT